MGHVVWSGVARRVVVWRMVFRAHREESEA
jgi:hypothetical protein